MRNSRASDKQEVFDLLIADANTPFSGWDFSYISGSHRMVESPLSWSYASKVLPYLRRAHSLLDMGTGGGEFLSRLRPLPENTCVTEAYAPNLPIARQRLEPLGVDVYEIDEDDKLPFRDEQFDLVINRHESFSCGEIRRVLGSGHHFITQQMIDTRKDSDIRHVLGYDGAVDTVWDIKAAVTELREQSFQIVEEKEEFLNTRFYDVGALVFYLKAIPWVVPGFTVEEYLGPLFKLHERVQQQGYVDFQSNAAFLIARKSVHGT